MCLSLTARDPFRREKTGERWYSSKAEINLRSLERTLGARRNATLRGHHVPCT
ncbi:hypothetical protein AtNW77_Chr2g0254861 [Arabidopsis thaliana]|uniref:Uncharacterized protein n=4 Tax=Arabidopsis TaxID=3701 RepID=A0A178VUW4_ARATH|nr:uncharacterized protein AT2G34238 [Arabidopsis thaliana]KAG7638442.1 hypothetical protein ISN45_At02g028770 [Arabidopsis thaliana x Arabidopsis arenosa]KAG7643057.1 hypothetical protein ISN44_As02g029010 [Arabidopsis suecica]AEC08941.1 hypothetical protein AT2G34238 [Arabidopsis thaliana]OAP10197.1 hypothetical protein AXX17_AT2G30720 [Arabidopsis thaliana]CAA0374523.1 unnamed protein product [Arabidopsis thaliana]|eukprot:NP_001318350.1 hypothetical protein AT2G34238 [Arabidopsis thaliana]